MIQITHWESARRQQGCWAGGLFPELGVWWFGRDQSVQGIVSQGAHEEIVVFRLSCATFFMKQFGGGRVFCHGGVKLSFPEGLHHGKNFIRHELSCLLVLSAILAMLESESFPLLLLCLPVLGLEGTQLFMSLSLCREGNSSHLHSPLQPRGEREKLAQRGETL